MVPLPMNAPFGGLRPLVLALEEFGTDELVATLDRFLDGFTWAIRTGRTWIALSVPGVLGVFLVELDPAKLDVDRY